MALGQGVECLQFGALLLPLCLPNCSALSQQSDCFSLLSNGFVEAVEEFLIVSPLTLADAVLCGLLETGCVLVAVLLQHIKLAFSVLFIGDQMRDDGHIFLDWCAADGVSDLLQRVQFGSPLPLAILHFFAATRYEVEAHKKSLVNFKARADTTNWLKRTPTLNAHIQKMRDDAYGAEDEEEADERADAAAAFC